MKDDEDKLTNAAADQAAKQPEAPVKSSPEPQPAEVKTPEVQNSKKEGSAVHDSNPFTTAITGIKKLFKHNSGTLVGLGFFNILLGIFMILSVAAIMFAAVAFFLRHFDFGVYASLFMPADVTNFFSGFADVNIYITWGVGALILLVLGTLMEALQIKIATSSIRNEAISFGQLIKSSTKSIMPLIALGLLVIVVVAIVTIITAALSSAIGPIAVVLLIAMFIAAIYLGVRWGFAPFAIVGDQSGPVQSLKRSWELTSGHFAETLGIGAATALMISVPLSLISTLAQYIQNGIGNTIMMIVSLAGLVVSAVIMAGIAERYQQLINIKEGKAQASKTHFMNYLAPVLFIGASIIVGSIAPKQTIQQTTPYQFDGTSNQEYQQLLRDLEQQSQDNSYNSLPSDNTSDSSTSNFR